MAGKNENSDFAKKLGARLAQANEEHKDKPPIDVGRRQLPAGIKEGVAKLSTMYTKEYEDDKAGMKGETFFRASAIVISPETHAGEKTAGQVTSLIIPLCDKPAKGKSKATSFNENWFTFTNFFKNLGVPPCPHTPATDPTGLKIQEYFFAAMAALVDPDRLKTNPIYISFSTRGWTPPLTLEDKAAGKEENEEMVFETWHGLAKFDGKIDPGAGVGVAAAASTQPDPMAPPPTPGVPALAQAPAATPPAPPTSPPVATTTQDPGEDYAEMVAALVEVAMADPKGETEEGAEASLQLEQLAQATGWTVEQIDVAADWAAVGEMAMNGPILPQLQPKPSSNGQVPPTVGSKHMFAKRKKDGSKLADGKGVEFPPNEVEVVTVDAAAKTCTIKTVKDGKPVVDVRSKQPVAVRWEWLEGPPY